MSASVRELLTGIVDYAGYFPPAGLSLEQVIRNYLEYLSTDHAWMLGRLVLPINQLSGMESLLPSELSAPIRVSVVVAPMDDSGQAFREALEQIRDWNAKHSELCLVDSIECKVETVEQLRGGVELGQVVLDPLDSQPSECSTYPQRFWELPLNDSREALIEELAKLRQHTAGSPNKIVDAAKIRTGGVVLGAIPGVENVGRFITTCARHRVPFKATAGLHHPLRSRHPLTYASDAPCDVMHGFLNVFLAATLAWHKPDSTANIDELLLSGDPSQFHVESAGIRWNQRTFTAPEINQARQEFAISFGSCSFDEPVRDLIDLGWL